MFMRAVVTEEIDFRHTSACCGKPSSVKISAWNLAIRQKLRGTNIRVRVSGLTVERLLFWGLGFRVKRLGYRVGHGFVFWSADWKATSRRARTTAASKALLRSAPDVVATVFKRAASMISLQKAISSVDPRKESSAAAKAKDSREEVGPALLV